MTKRWRLGALSVTAPQPWTDITADLPAGTPGQEKRTRPQDPESRGRHRFCWCRRGDSNPHER